MWYVYTMEYYSAIKMEDFTYFVGKSVELENIIPSEVTRTQNKIHGMFSLISGYLSQSSEYPQYNS